MANIYELTADLMRLQAMILQDGSIFLRLFASDPPIRPSP